MAERRQMLLVLQTKLLHRGHGRKHLSLSEAQNLGLFRALKESSSVAVHVVYLQMFHETRDRETEDTASSKIPLASGEAAHL